MKHIVKIPRASIARVEIYLAQTYNTVQQIQAETGADYVITATFYDPRTWSAVCHVKADGKVIANDASYNAYGYMWDTPEDFAMALLPDRGGERANYYTCCQLIKDGAPLPKLYYNADVGGRRPRTAVCETPTEIWLYAGTDAQTPEELRDYLAPMGVRSAVMGDGGGKVNFAGGGRVIQGSDPSQNVLLVYLDKSAGEDPGDKEESKPMSTYKKGIDVSKWQGTIDWEKVKAAGIEFAMIRAGYGQNNIDEQFVRNISECNRLGIFCGVYWFSYAYSEDMARKEAEYALAAVKPYKLDYPIAFDYEYDSADNAQKHGVSPDKDHVSALARSFCNRLEDAGYYAMVYTNPAYLAAYFDATIPEEYDIWLAQWPKNPNLESKPAQAGGIWQYSATGSVSGINADVDLNAAYVDYPAVIASAGLNKPSDSAGIEQPQDKPADEEPETEEKTEAELAREWVIAQGISDGSNPKSAATREQVWMMLRRMMTKED